MRSAGCAANDVADREFDRHVKRTAAAPGDGRRGRRRARRWRSALRSRSSPSRWRLTTNLATVAWSVVALAIDARLSVQQALLRDAAGGARHRVQLRHPDGVRRGARRRCLVARSLAGAVPRARLVAARRQPVLGPRLRHRVRHGRSRRRPADRHQDLGDHARPLRRGRRDGVLRRLPGDLGRGRRARSATAGRTSSASPSRAAIAAGTSR